ncbi:MAG TPA: serine/threonine-protein kinase, partial [Gemmataceae bacterium]
GPYTLRRPLGEGAMGAVFLAEQAHPVRRQVAVKILKPGLDSRRVVARFEAERQALALMDHPNIAKVLDAGQSPPAAAGGPSRPYFVMELVEGVPITQFCDDRRLTPRQRLRLFVDVCRAVQHAHQKGVIHRDLKPSNVLVAEQDGKPVPKVIDFGVAKATGPRLTEQGNVTEVGTVIGTLEYMSPEQTEPNPLDVDTRSDVYSLGVLLYELLTGTTPLPRHRLKDAGWVELLRLVREEEPPRPSTRLTDTTEELPAIAARRGVEPKKLGGLVRGDLDRIVMKALAKDRDRRYATANGLARDVERYLNDEPVEAAPPGAGYRLRKFVKRNKGRVVAAGLVLAALLAGVAGTTWGMIRADRARQEAEAAQAAEARRAAEAQRRLEQVERGAEVLAGVFQDLDPKAEQKEGVTLRVLLGRRLGDAARQLDGEAVGDPLVVARLQHLLGVSLYDLGQLDQAEAVLDTARQTRERLLGADDPDTLSTKHNLASVYRLRGKLAEAEALSLDVVAGRTARLGADHAATLSSQNNLAVVYMDRGKLAEAEAVLTEVLAVRTAQLGADDLKTIQIKHNLASLYQDRAKYAQAEALLTEVVAVRTARLGRGHIDTIQSKNNLAEAYRTQGKFAEAEALLREVVETSAAELGPGHPSTLTGKHNLATLYLQLRRTAEAEQPLREVVEAQTARFGADHPNTLNSRNTLAGLYTTLKKFDRAIPLFEEVLRQSRDKLGPDHPGTLTTQANLGATYREAERYADAIPLLEDARRRGGRYPELAWVGNALLKTYARAGKAAEAKALAEEEVRAARRRFPADSPQLAAALATAGQALLDVKAYAEAEPLLLEGYDGQKRRAAANPARLTEALERLVRLYDAWGQPERAAEWRAKLDEAKATKAEPPRRP